MTDDGSARRARRSRREGRSFARKIGQQRQRQLTKPRCVVRLSAVLQRRRRCAWAGSMALGHGDVQSQGWTACVVLEKMR